MARINNTTSTRGTVRSIQLYFRDAENLGMYLEPGSTMAEYGVLVHYVSERVDSGYSIATLKQACSALDQLLEVNRLDLVMHLVDFVEFEILGISVEAEFLVQSTGHGPVEGQAVLLVKNAELKEVS